MASDPQPPESSLAGSASADQPKSRHGRAARTGAIPPSADAWLELRVPLARGAMLLEPAPHRFGERFDPAPRPDVDGHLADAPFGVEAEEVDPLELAVSDPGAEGQRRGVAALELVG